MANKKKSTVNQEKSRTSVGRQESEAGKTEAPDGESGASEGGAGRRRRASKPRTSTPRSAKHKAAAPEKGERLTGRAVMRKAYKNVSEKLNTQNDSSNAIDDLVKLMKIEKDWGGDTKGVKEIKVRWEQEKDKSSKEK